MIYVTKDNIFRCDVEALVNPVNCKGVMGAGLALKFKYAFQENFRFYKNTCNIGMMKIGKVLVYDGGITVKPRYIINFPTKDDWRDSSKLEYIETGFDDLTKKIIEKGIRSIAIPALGCGLGGLQWSQVREVMLEKLKLVESEPSFVTIYLLEP